MALFAIYIWEIGIADRRGIIAGVVTAAAAIAFNPLTVVIVAFSVYYTAKIIKGAQLYNGSTGIELFHWEGRGVLSVVLIALYFVVAWWARAIEEVRL